MKKEKPMKKNKTANPESYSYKAGYEEGYRAGVKDAKNKKESREKIFPFEDDFDIGFVEGYKLAYNITSLEMVI